MNRNDISKTTRMKVMIDAFECVKDTYFDTIATLKSCGFKKLGAGHYGSAWTRKDIEGWAIKISGADDGDSFPAYVYWCMANPMPHIPEYQFPVFSSDRQQFMVMMPMYSDCSYDIEQRCGEVYDIYSDMGGVLRGFMQPVQGPHFEIMHAAQQIRAFFSGKVSFDMHSENVMIDPQTNRLIITDPIHQGDTDSMITQITGVSCVPKPQLRDQLPLELGLPSAHAAPVNLQDSVLELRELFRNLAGGCKPNDRFDVGIGQELIQPMRTPDLHGAKKRDCIGDMMIFDMAKEQAVQLKAQWLVDQQNKERGGWIDQRRQAKFVNDLRRL